MTDSRVQKAIVSLVALKKRKHVSQFRDETRSSLAPLLHALKRRQRPAASYPGLSKSSTLKRGASILLKYFHCFFFLSFLLCHSHFFYFCLFPFCTFVSVLSFCLWLLLQWTHYPWIEAVPDTRKDFNHLTFYSLKSLNILRDCTWLQKTTYQKSKAQLYLYTNVPCLWMLEQYSGKRERGKFVIQICLWHQLNRQPRVVELNQIECVTYLKRAIYLSFTLIFRHAGRAPYYWPPRQNLVEPCPKWMSCKCAFDGIVLYVLQKIPIPNYQAKFFWVNLMPFVNFNGD